MKPHKIEVNIGELVLEGFEPGDRYGIGEAVERELTGALGDAGKRRNGGTGGADSRPGFLSGADQAARRGEGHQRKQQQGMV